MKPITRWAPALMATLLLAAAPLWAEDMRDLQVQARQAKEALIQKAASERTAAEQAAAEKRASIVRDRAALEKGVADLEAPNRDLKRDVQELTQETRLLEGKEAELTRQLAQTDAMIQELVGVIRVNAKDMDAMAAQNLQTALAGDQPAYLRAVADAAHFPGMQEVAGMARALFNQIHAAGEVTSRRAKVIDRAGRETEADILALGPFTAAYRIDGEVGFLTNAGNGRLSALSRLPSAGVRKKMARYMEGRAEAVPMDISRGAALHQMTHAVSFWQQVPKGGPIGWMIVAIFAAGLIIVAERFLFLRHRRLDGDAFLNRIQHLASEENWRGAEQLCAEHAQKPLARVVRAGLENFRLAREEMENALQEAILREIPPMERFLSTLTMLAAIAPLLGLLGTVTGMINTFHVITLHGSADPRLMSSGISEALVTTMLGLIAAIPIMLLHTLLSRGVDGHIAQMEEKAMAMVNFAHKRRGLT
ncbi:MAG: MotA/TolQ/ExbB proton channel family protein [Desulfatitalea sp.]